MERERVELVCKVAVQRVYESLLLGCACMIGGYDGRLAPLLRRHVGILPKGLDHCIP